MKHFAALFLFMSLAALFSMGCRKTADSAANPPNPPSDADQDDGPPGVASPDVLALAQGNNEFAFDLYARLAKKDGNVVFSPYSISSALAMTYAGARGTTADEMAKTLRFPLKPERLHPAFADLSDRTMRAGKHRAGQLLVANSLWGQHGYALRDDFLRLTRDDYHAEMKEVDFQGDTEGARQAINGWVELQTQNMIRELLKPGTLNPQSRLVLVNAIYFHLLWATPFLADQTKEAPFRTLSGERVRVPMMRVTDQFSYCEEDGVQVLELPYQHKSLSMIVILPQAGEGSGAVEGALTEARVEKWLTNLAPREVIVTLPKFTATCDFQLGEELRALGMRLAFQSGQEGQLGADFSGIGDQAIGSAGSLHISEVVHQARVEVSEEGTKAVAATAVVTEVPNSAVKPLRWVTFQADHPFFFLIHDQDTGSIMFVGRFTRPGA